MCLPGCCGTRSGAKITAIYSMLSGSWYGIQAIFAFTDTLVLESLHGLDGVMIFLVSCCVLSIVGAVLMSGARQLSRAKVLFWLVLFGAMLSVRLVYLGMLVVEIRYEDHDVHRVMYLLGPTIMTTIFLLADLWSIITVVQFLRDLRANRYSHKETNRALATSSSLGKSVFAWNSGSPGYAGSDSSGANGTLTSAQLGHLPPGLQKAYASAMASGRPFTTKDYHYLMMQYDLYETSQQQLRDKQHQQLQYFPHGSRPSAHTQTGQSHIKAGNLYGASGSALPPPLPPGRYSLQQQQQQQAALRRMHRDSTLFYGGGGSSSSYNDDDIQWNYLAPAMAAGYLAVQCMDATFDGGDMSSALAAVDI